MIRFVVWLKIQHKGSAPEGVGLPLLHAPLCIISLCLFGRESASRRARCDKSAYQGSLFDKASNRVGFGSLRFRDLVHKDPRLFAKRESGNYFLSQSP